MARKRLRAEGNLAALARLSTASLADALVRLKLPLRIAPQVLKPIVPGSRAYGPVLPIRHFGSVDVFLEALERAKPGDIVVIDNGGRTDEGTIGDLIVREFKKANIAAVILFGTHRDTAEIRAIGLPVWSLGACPAGPLRVTRQSKTAFTRARLGELVATARDIVVADEDGIIVFEKAALGEIAAAAAAIREREGAQAAKQDKGVTLRRQLRFADYLERRKKNPALTFRRHLQDVAGAIEV